VNGGVGPHNSAGYGMDAGAANWTTATDQNRTLTAMIDTPVQHAESAIRSHTGHEPGSRSVTDAGLRPREEDSIRA
jgi:hypothetical protein